MALDTSPVSSTLLCANCNYMFYPKPRIPAISSDIIRSHRPPSDTEASQNISYIEQDRLELERYDVEIGRIRNILEKLEEERNAIWQRIRQRRSWLASIRRLPAEVLEKILCLSREGTHSLTISKDKFDSPVFDLYQVCWYWRHITMTRPEWWRLVHVDLRGMSKDTLCLLKAYMGVSGSFELSIHIKDSEKAKWSRYRETYGENLGTPGLCVFVAILREARRIRDLTLEVPLDILDEAAKQDPDLFKDSKITFPLLRTVAFVEEVIDGNSHLYKQLEISAPLLTEITVQESKYDAYDTEFYRSWPLDQLSSLKTRGVITTLSDFTALERLDMFQYYSSLLPEIDELSTIRHLTLHYASSEHYDPFFRQVNLPALDSLSLRPRSPRVTNFTWPSTHFLDMLRRSTPTIKHIDIDLPNATLYPQRTADGDSSMLDLFRCCPDLEVLHVNLTNGDILFASLRKLADAGIRFPKLKDIDIRTADTTQGTEEGEAKRAMLEELIERITAKVR